MRRVITDYLAAWKDLRDRRPLLLRGARQVGKTWTVRDFGERQFGGRVHVLDFEREPALRELFAADLVPARIVDALRVRRDISIEPGRDMLFFDEVQACPRAIVSLRYFYEELPQLHVIAAGSLLEFALGSLSFPVGRIHPQTLHPMTFVEFLWATGADRAAELVAAGPARLDDSMHRDLLDKLRAYLFVGGMPAAVRDYSASRSLADAMAVQSDLLHTYRDDFGKYSPRANQACIDAVLTGAAKSVGQVTKYRALAPGFGDHPIRDAYDLLTRARLLRQVPAASPAGLPLAASASPRRFKTLLLDVGLLQRLLGVPAGSEWDQQDLLALYSGALAEQFVGQELVAGGDDQVYCWMRAAKSSSAEVDYLVAPEGHITPIEVKSGAAGRLRSMHQLLLECPHCAPGLVLSTRPYAELPEQNLVFAPIYYAGALAGGRAAGRG
jgi:uncharacterized protein